MAAVLIPSCDDLEQHAQGGAARARLITWCRKRRISPSRLLMPLSFLSILGGTCSLIGTSTNLVVQGLLIKSKLEADVFLRSRFGRPALRSFWGLFYLLTVGRKLLPDRKEMIEQLEETQARVSGRDAGSTGLPAGEQVGCRGRTSAVARPVLDRDRPRGSRPGPVSPDELIRVDDRLIFTGVVNTIVDLEKIPGLVPADRQPVRGLARQAMGKTALRGGHQPELRPWSMSRCADADFRALYDAAIVAVHRNGTRV